MPRIEYEPWNPKGETLALVRRANEIIEEYAAQGFDMTLRQVYYQLVSRDVIPNKQSEYKRLGDIISKARRAGLIDWDSIVDRTRFLRSLTHWTGPESILRAVAQQFRTDPWQNQGAYVEVWFEKDALVGVFERPANEWHVPFFSCRGYTSDSELWSAARRLARVTRTGRKAIVLHFGDHDPSGIDMSRDVADRLRLFEAGDVEVKRIALTYEQVEEHNPPPNPAKETDSRFESYRELYGEHSWELDALDPTTLAALVRREVEVVIDRDEWRASLNRDAIERKRLEQIATNYATIVKSLD